MKAKDDFFNELYHNNYTMLYKYTLRICPCAYLTEDIVQETFYIAYRRLDMLYSHEKPVGWLIVTAKHVSKDKMRKESKYSRQFSLEDVLSHEGGYSETEINSTLKQILSFDDYLLYSEFYTEGYSLKEIGISRNKSAAAISQKLYRIRSLIRKYFFNYSYR